MILSIVSYANSISAYVVFAFSSSCIGQILFQMTNASTSKKQLTSSWWNATDSSFCNPLQRELIVSLKILHLSLKEALFVFSAAASAVGGTRWQIGQIEIYLTKFQQRATGAPYPASLSVLLSFGRKSFFITIFVQLSGKLLPRVQIASPQRVVCKIEFCSPTNPQTSGVIQLTWSQTTVLGILVKKTLTNYRHAERTLPLQLSQRKAHMQLSFCFFFAICGYPSFLFLFFPLPFLGFVVSIYFVSSVTS